MGFVDLHDPFDLGEEPVEEAEGAPRDSDDDRDGLGIGEVLGVEGEAEFAPMAFGQGRQNIEAARSEEPPFLLITSVWLYR